MSNNTVETHRGPYPTLSYPETDIYSLIFGELNEHDAQLLAITELTTDNSVTYAELKAMAEAIAGELSARGIGAGDVVTLQIPNSINFAAALLGILRIGAICNPVGMLMNQADVAHILEASESKLFIGPTNMEQVPQIFSMELEAIARRNRTAPDIAVDVDSVAAIPFSSGTTGLPKGVQLTHRNLVSNMLQTNYMMERNGITPTTPTLTVLPFSHIYGFTVLLLTPLMNRQHLFTLPKFDMQQFLRAHKDHDIAMTFIAPPMAVALAKDETIDPEWFAASRLILCGAAPIDADTTRHVENRYGTKLIQAWGMTEASPVVTMNIHGETGIESVGMPVPDSEIRVVALETTDDVARGEQGEILVRGPQVMKGYLNNDKANAEIFVDGWMRTGDIGYIDDTGGLRIVDRAKEVIKYKGYQVAPAELEALLLGHPEVKDVGVVGADQGGLEIPHAFVVKRDGASVSEDELTEWVAERVTPYKKIRAVTFIGEVPRNPSGKILRRELRART
ncbi:AMP-binding protein [Corynebacterium mayonis]|uniref:AMP-binding protein n=1 Tax=Corynebacterium mayonis TaxID=3062461 RepID=UPI00313FE620